MSKIAVAGAASRQQNLSGEQKRELLARLLRQRSGTRRSTPLSPGQRSLWFLEKLTPGTAVYHLPYAFRIDQQLDLRAFVATVGEIVKRHETLRTSFAEVGSRPVQMIAETPPRATAVVDLSGLLPEARRPAAQQVAHESATRPFDLHRAPLVRVVLARLAEREYVLSVTLHHIVSDAWSVGVFFQEFAALYQAFSKDPGAASPLSPLPIQYSDVTRSQLRWLESEACTRELAFWRSRLEGVPASLELPADRPRPAVRSPGGGEYQKTISRALSEDLKAVGERSGATLFMTFLTAFAVLVMRYTGQRDFLVGTSVAGRNRPEAASLIGYFVNMLALRMQVERDPTFAAQLRRVREVTVEALARQELPFARLIEELQPDRNLSQDPLFQIVLDFVPRREGNSRTGDLKLDQFVVRRGTAIVDLEIDLMEEERVDGAWQCTLYWSTDLFMTTSMMRFLHHFHNLLRAVAGDAERRISELPLLSPAETGQLLLEWNDTRTTDARQICFSRLFAARVAAVPEAVAAVSESAALSYGELSARADRLAHYLRARRVGRESRVGVFGERGLGMLTAILGILKSGAAWVPFDPAHPDQRLATVIAGSGVELVATQGSLAHRLLKICERLSPAPGAWCWDGAPAGSEVADLQSLAGESAAQAPLAGSGPEDLAYVFYTSGSTGLPKGAMVKHGGMINHLWAKVELLRLDQQCAVVQNASHCFDIFVWQLLAPLVVGGRVVIYTGETAYNPAALLAHLERDRVTVLEIVPSVLDGLLEEVAERRKAGRETRLPTLVHLLSTGEALPVALARRWFELFAQVPLINAFGPTECSDDTTHEVLRAAPPATARRTAVGRPIRGFAIYVLDPALDPVPLGCQGQVTMAGVGVGRGYLGAPATTAAAFVPHPFSEVPGERLYLSGDLGRFTPDGVLEFIGRIDNQVKVRGYRIEQGEVEAALGRHEAVHQVAVVVRSDGGGTNRLVAYLVAGEPLDDADLRVFLTASLPQYMVPEQFVQLDAMPLNRNGKIDRNALPEPPPMASHDAYTAPRNPLEAELAEIWQEVLGIPRVSVHDEFFELGGHSLKAIQVISRIERELGSEVSVRQLFLSPTVAELAATLQRHGVGLALPPIAGREVKPHYPLSVGQQAQWISAQMLVDQGNKSPEILELCGPLDRSALRAAIHRLGQRHEVLRTSFAKVAGQPRQTIHETMAFPCPETDLSGLEDVEEPLRRLFREEARPFDLTRPPLLRTRLVRLAAESHLLLLNLPHIISDGWSEQRLFQDLAALYNDCRAGRNPAPAPPPVRYVDFVAWQQEQMSEAALSAQRDYWLARLRDLPAPPPIPADPAPPERGEKPQPPSGAGLGAAVDLDPDLLARIDDFAGARGATRFMMFLAALKILLARWLGRTDVVVGSALGGRTRPELEQVVGLFINPVALRTDLEGNPGFAEVLGRVRRTTLEAIAHQDYPFQSWLEDLRHRHGTSEYMPYSVLLLPQQKPALAPFDELEVGFRLTLEFTAREFGRVNADLVGGPGMALILGAFETEEGLKLMVISGSDRLGKATLERLLSQLCALFDRVTQEPERRLGEICLLKGECERRTIAELARGGRAPQPEEAVLAALEAWTKVGSQDAVALVSGAGEVVSSDDPELLDPYRLGRWLVRHAATVLVAGAAIVNWLELALDQGLDARTLSLRRVVSVGGEPPAGAERLSRTAVVAIFHPLAEATAAGLWATLGAGAAEGALLAGRPAAAHPIHVLDAARGPVPIGILGEVCRQGAGERFDATGYRGRWRADGSLAITERSAADEPAPAPAGEKAALYMAPRTFHERRLAVTWKKVLGVPRVGIEDDFTALGGTRHRAIELGLALGAENILLLPGQIANYPTIAALAPVIEREMKLEGGGNAPPLAPLTPLQRTLLAAALAEPRRVVRCAVVEVAEELDAELLGRALTALARRHDALRSVFLRDGGLWMQRLREDAAVPLRVVELAGATPQQRRTAFERAVEALRAEVDPIAGPPLHALLGRGSPPGKLALAASGLVVDEASWPVMVADLLAAYRQAAGQIPSVTRPAAPSFQAWLVAAERLRVYREPPAEGEPPALSERWDQAGFVTTRLLAGSQADAPAASAAHELGPLLATALGRALPAVVEVARDRRASAPALPELSAAVGQFGALPPASAEAAGNDAGRRVRLHLIDGAAMPSAQAFSLPAAGPPLVTTLGEREPEVLVVVTASAEELRAAIAVRPDLRVELDAGKLGRDLACQLETMKPSPSGAPALPGLADVELEQADLDEIFG